MSTIHVGFWPESAPGRAGRYAGLAEDDDELEDLRDRDLFIVSGEPEALALEAIENIGCKLPFLRRIAGEMLDVLVDRRGDVSDATRAKADAARGREVVA